MDCSRLSKQKAAYILEKSVTTAFDEDDNIVAVVQRKYITKFGTPFVKTDRVEDQAQSLLKPAPRVNQEKIENRLDRKDKS